jgi:hypothetical protein
MKKKNVKTISIKLPVELVDLLNERYTKKELDYLIMEMLLQKHRRLSDRTLDLIFS